MHENLEIDLPPELGARLRLEWLVKPINVADMLRGLDTKVDYLYILISSCAWHNRDHRNPELYRTDLQPVIEQVQARASRRLAPGRTRASARVLVGRSPGEGRRSRTQTPAPSGARPPSHSLTSRSPRPQRLRKERGITFFMLECPYVVPGLLPLNEVDLETNEGMAQYNEVIRSVKGDIWHRLRLQDVGAACGDGCNIDGVHQINIVYEAVVQQMLNMLLQDRRKL